MKKLLLCLMLSPLLTSCVSIPSDTNKQHLTNIGNEVIITWPADQNHVYMKTIDGNRTVCRSPSPDFAVAHNKGITLGLTQAGSESEQLGDTKSQSDTSLGGRGPSALIVREVLYRSCEMTLNVNASEEETEAIFFKTLNILSNMIKAVPAASPEDE
ncbi:MAG: hypothetical protein AB8B80_17305 [Marinicellaceae bacterium]